MSGGPPHPKACGATTAGTIYTARAWFRADAPGKIVCLRLREWSGSTLLGSARICTTTTATWAQTAAFTYTAVGGGSLDLDAYQQTAAATGDALDIDGVLLTRG